MTIRRIALAAASAGPSALLFLWAVSDRLAPGQDATIIGLAAFAAVFFGLLAAAP